MNRLKKKYQQEITPELMKLWQLTSHLAVPRIQKVVINIGIKDGAGDKGVVKKIADYITLIAGQKAIITRARQAEAAFKIRKNDSIGVKATLRGERMYQFLDKLISIVFPQIRDFQGIHWVLRNKSFFQRLIMIQSIPFVVCRSLLLLIQKIIGKL